MHHEWYRPQGALARLRGLHWDAATPFRVESFNKRKGVRVSKTKGVATNAAAGPFGRSSLVGVSSGKQPGTTRRDVLSRVADPALGRPDSACRFKIPPGPRSAPFGPGSRYPLDS